MVDFVSAGIVGLLKDKLHISLSSASVGSGQHALPLVTRLNETDDEDYGLAPSVWASHQVRDEFIARLVCFSSCATRS